MDNNETKTKGRQFAVKIAQLYKNLSNNKKENVLSDQLLRAGAGIGANLAEAECAANKDGFVAKIQEALQKCAVTKYWLEILKEADFITEFEFNNAIQDCDELRKILFYTIKSLKAASTTPAPTTPASPGQASPAQPKPPVPSAPAKTILTVPPTPPAPKKG
jgi:four helix bundle protein